MTRLIAFGCSMTYGHCLPSRDLAWPSQLSRVLGLDCVNMSRVGSSNKQIWHDLINFDFQEDDIVFVLWSYPSRSCVLKNKKESINIGHWLIEESQLSKTFYENFYTKYDMETQSKLFVSHANLFLAGKKITIYNLCIEKSHTLLFEMGVNHIPLHFGSYEKIFPKADDNLHPGVDAHAMFSRDILMHLGRTEYKHIPKKNPMSLVERLSQPFDFKNFYEQLRKLIKRL